MIQYHTKKCNPRASSTCALFNLFIYVFFYYFPSVDEPIYCFGFVQVQVGSGS